jgi:hypothetical protein
MARIDHLNGVVGNGPGSAFRSLHFLPFDGRAAGSIPDLDG